MLSGLRSGRPARAWHNQHLMATVERTAFGNHEVVNQPPPLVDYNVFEADTVLVEAVGARVPTGIGSGSRPRASTPAAERRRSWADWRTRTGRS